MGQGNLDGLCAGLAQQLYTFLHVFFNFRIQPLEKVLPWYADLHALQILFQGVAEIGNLPGNGC